MIEYEESKKRVERKRKTEKRVVADCSTKNKDVLLTQ